MVEWWKFIASENVKKMAIPDYQTIMLPLLKFLGDGNEHSFREAVDFICTSFELSDDEKRQKLASGQMSVIDNRVSWAKLYMKKANVLEATRKGHFKINERGLQILKENPTTVNIKYLKKYPEFFDFRKSVRGKDEIVEHDEYDLETPVELLESAYQRINHALAEDLLKAIKECSPGFFERLVIDLLLKMGYGGSRKDAGEAIGRSGDEGVDGIIKEDKLGLDVIYVQAKRWEGTIGRPVIQGFVGALHGKKANKGVFITTSNFSKDARDYASSIGTKVILIDGEELASYMIENNVGVFMDRSYEIKRIDSDYFSDELPT
jgi:restriction system protein